MSAPSSPTGSLTSADTTKTAGATADARHQREFEALAEHLAFRRIAVESVVDAVRGFSVAVPSWAFGTGGTRFGRFPGPGEPRTLTEKIEDAAVVHRLTAGAPRVSLHIPWDAPQDPTAILQQARELGLTFDAINSNTFQDQAGQTLSYKLGSLSHADAAVRAQAVEHNLECIELGKMLGADALSIWLADGSNYPGQMSLRGSFDRLLDSLRHIYSRLPSGWRLFTEHKPYEPAFYATVVQDWGSSLMLAQALGDQAQCLVDLGHHLPNTNIELIVARLLTAGKLGGFHFNDSKYGDDDLTAGSIKPYGLFLIFHELVLAERAAPHSFNPAYMIDQSHNLKDPIEALLQTVDQLQLAYAKASLVDHAALHEYQECGDVIMAERTLKEAFETDVRPLVAEARRRSGAALDPVLAFRASGYRAQKARERIGSAYVPPRSL